MYITALSFFFDYCGANFNRKHYWQTAEEEVQYNDPDGLNLRGRFYPFSADLYKKSSAPYEAEAIDLEADLYDHIHDHRHDRSTWRQDATRARKVIFAVAERSEKR